MKIINDKYIASNGLRLKLKTQSPKHKTHRTKLNFISILFDSNISKTIS